MIALVRTAFHVSHFHKTEPKAQGLQTPSNLAIFDLIDLKILQACLESLLSKWKEKTQLQLLKKNP